MTFLPRHDLFGTLEELDRLCSGFIAKGVPQDPPDWRRSRWSGAT